VKKPAEIPLNFHPHGNQAAEAGGRGKSSCGRRGLASRVPSAAVRFPASPDEARPIAAAAEQERVRSPTWSPGRRRQVIDTDNIQIPNTLTV